MFSLNHIIWILICVALITALLIISVKKKFSLKVASLIMSGISLASELCKIFTHMTSSTGMVIKPTALPLHLCSVLIFVIFYITFAKKSKLTEILISFLVPIGIIGGALAILIATSGVKFTEPEPYQCFIYHAGLIWYALHIIITKETKIDIKAYLRNMLILACLSIVMIWVNGALSVYDTNFLYVVRPPADNLPILNLNNGWYVYFISLLGSGLLLITLFYVPFILVNKSKVNK